MIEIKNEHTYKGTRIVVGNEKRKLLSQMALYLVKEGFVEISIPIIQFSELFQDKVGEENNNLMFNFKDRADREICLAPEYTAVVQKLASTTFKHRKDVFLFYIQECFRGEKPQAGRYRQFTQLGVEILNPTKDYNSELLSLARLLINFAALPLPKKEYEDVFLENLEINTDAKRGLDYYKEGKGFEIAYKALGAQKQICGGGEYEGGTGFALGVDRLMLIQALLHN